MRQLKVGDKVKLTGKTWKLSCPWVKLDDIVVVGKIEHDGSAWAAKDDSGKSVGSLTLSGGRPYVGDYDIELVEEEPVLEPPADGQPEIKYAMQLSGVDLGKRIVWIHEYKYKGEQREKVKEATPIKIEHSKKYVSLKVRKKVKTYYGSYYMTTVSASPIKVDAVVAVYPE